MLGRLGLEDQSASNSSNNTKPVVVSLYGVPGLGKTFLLNELKDKLGDEHFIFYNGSKMISDVVPRGLEAFKKLEEQEKVDWCQAAINNVRNQCTDSDRVEVVTSHLMFWDKEEESETVVYTQNDLNTYTHIMYLNTPTEVIRQHHLADGRRSHLYASISHLRKWQEKELDQLCGLCHCNNILFLSILPSLMLLDRTITLLHDFRRHSEKYNMSDTERRLDEVMLTYGS
ncbi:hypothetical protein FQN50_006457 [Emmonsiellopsis sp. PD_5]|nr:hypothetical protein FQN50_006457 [Emmonsiellopsis sp. PD_5]